MIKRWRDALMSEICRGLLLPHRLVITRAAWEAGLRPLLARPGGFAVGRMRSLSAEREQRLLVERVEVDDRLPTGDRFAPLDDWFVLHVATAGRVTGVALELLARLRPKASQTVAALVVASGGQDDSSGWDGAIRLHGGQVRLLDGLQIVGSGMLCVDREPVAELPGGIDGSGGDDGLRYSRLTGAVGARVARRLRSAAVTVIGAGRNGGAAALQLAALGVRTLRLVDADLMGLENLDAMPLAIADVGKPKVTALAARLRALRPDLVVSCFAAPTSAQQMIAAHRRLPADLILTAVDSDTPRLAASLLSRETLAVHVDLGTHVARDASGAMRLSGDVRLLVPGAGGCVACVGGLADRDQTLYELFAPPGSLHRGLPSAWHEQRAGSLVSLNAITVGVAVQAWLDLLAGRLAASCWHRLRWTPGEGLQSHAALVSAAEDCPFCRPGGA
jgi:molybdopterin/thiamine biosynthesis adenylyltransferase